MGMEYTDGMMEQYNTESGNREREMVKDILGHQMATNTGESSRMACNGDRQSNKRREYYTMQNMKKASPSPGVKYSEVFQSLR